MCEGYWDRRLARWVSLEEIQDQELEDLLNAKTKLPVLPAAETRRKPAALLR